MGVSAIRIGDHLPDGGAQRCVPRFSNKLNGEKSITVTIGDPEAILGEIQQQVGRVDHPKDDDMDRDPPETTVR